MKTILMLAMFLCACVPAPRPDSRPDLTPQAAYQVGSKALVIVMVKTHNGAAQGSGALVGSIGSYSVVLTAAHLFGPNSEGPIMIIVPDDTGDGGMASAGVLVDVDHDIDLALIAVEKRLPEQVPLRAAPHDPELYSPVYLIGNPENAPRVMGAGVVDFVGRNLDGKKTMQITGFCWPGHSGGPVLDRHGALVGVIRAVHSAPDHHAAPDEDGETPGVIVQEICYAVPLKTIQKFLAKHGVM